jgi:WD40 repeat protein
VTTTGTVVLLDPTHGTVTRTLVPGGAVGDALAVSPDGRTVYYEVATGCQHQIWEVPTAGGTGEMVTSAGSRPAVSPDGRMLAYVRQDLATAPDACPHAGATRTADYQVIVQDLTAQTATRYPMPPGWASSGLPAPVGHLSWSPDGSRLAVTVTPFEDNENWRLHILVLSADTTYLSDSGAGDVPVSGGAPHGSYYREAVFLPDGTLLAARQCCAGEPATTTSVGLLTFDPATGQVDSQVAIGLTDRDHTSLDASADGHWLLYLSGHDLEVSQDGAKPTVLASGFTAAAW